MSAASTQRFVDPNADGTRHTVRPIARDLARRAVDAYRTAHALSGGPFPQVQGLLRPDALAALADSRSICAPLPGGRQLEVPVLTPIDLAPWYASDFREARFPDELRAGTPVWHLSTFPAVPDDDFATMFSVAMEQLRRLHPGGSIVFADHADRADDPSGERLADLFSAARAPFAELAVTGHGPAREHYFAGRASADPVPDQIDIVDLRTRVTGPTTDQRFLDELWAIYEHPFRSLSTSTPLRTYFERDELAAAISRPGVLQSEHRVDGRLVSWMMLTNDIASFPWMDVAAFAACAPDLAAQDIWVFPGVVTDQEYRGNHCTDRLIEAIAYRLASATSEALMVFETVDENVGFLPRLITDAVNGTGYATIDVREVGAQVHRAWSSVP